MAKGLTDIAALNAGTKLEFFQRLFDSVKIGNCATDQDHRFVVVNPAYCQTYGYSAARPNDVAHR